VRPVAAVFAGGGAIAQAVARALGRRGTMVAVSARTRAGADATVTLVRAGGGEAEAAVVDEPEHRGGGELLAERRDRQGVAHGHRGAGLPVGPPVAAREEGVPPAAHDHRQPRAARRWGARSCGGSSATRPWCSATWARWRTSAVLEQALDDPEPLVREHAAGALIQIGSSGMVEPPRPGRDPCDAELEGASGGATLIPTPGSAT
jgi:hypothetical protein